MKRILIARGAGDPADLRTPGLPLAPGAQGEDAGEAGSARAATVGAPARKGRLGPLLFLLFAITLGVGGYWVWTNPELVGLEDWSSVQAAFSGEKASPDASSEAGATPVEAPPTEATGEETSPGEEPAVPQEAAE